MTNEEPIFRIKSTAGYGYLRTEDWTNHPALNQFHIGQVTYTQHYPENGQARQARQYVS